MTPKDLKTGMVVEIRQYRSKYLVMRDTGLLGKENDIMVCFYEKHRYAGWMPLSSYHDDMTYWGHTKLFDEGKIVHKPDYDIMKVWQPMRAVGVGCIGQDSKLIYDREAEEGEKANG
ncbi:MAG: hypothetical protein IKH75_01325 [Ruminococcus sp.]|nr:hypothetical protein [Ruminococcus sp.]